MNINIRPITPDYGVDLLQLTGSEREGYIINIKGSPNRLLMAIYNTMMQGDRSINSIFIGAVIKYVQDTENQDIPISLC